MKKIVILTTSAILMSFSTLFAQINGNKIMFGPVAGFGSSYVANVPGVSKSVASGYAGIGAIDMINHWGVGAQAVLSSGGYQTFYRGLRMTDIPMYFRVPLRAYYFFGNRGNIVRPDVYFGPQFGLKTGEHLTTDNYFGDEGDTRRSDNFKTFDIGFDGGAGLNVQLTRSASFNIDFSYYQGVSDALKDPNYVYNPQDDVDVNMGLYFDIR